VHKDFKTRIVKGFGLQFELKRRGLVASSESNQPEFAQVGELPVKEEQHELAKEYTIDFDLL